MISSPSSPSSPAVAVDPDSALPPYEQIRGQLAGQIRSGQLVSGFRLPAIRRLAADLRVAPGTVARAYGELETAGLIRTSRSTGTRVRAPETGGRDAGRRSEDEELTRAAATFVRLARARAFSLADALGAIRTGWTAEESVQTGPPGPQPR